MAKQLSNQKNVFKIHSSRFRESNWNLYLTIEEAMKNKEIEEIIQLADSQNLRFIDEIIGKTDRDKNINSIKKKINNIINSVSNNDNKNNSDFIKKKKEIIQLYKKLNKEKMNEHYLCIVIDTISDFKKLNRVRADFKLNGIKYRRLLGTTGGIKNNTIVFVSEIVYDKLIEKIDNGRNKDKKMIPAKLEAYKALTCSSSIPVSSPKGILVVPDCITNFLEDVIYVEDSNGERPTVCKKRNFPIELTDSDGYGLILPKLAKQWGIDIKEVNEKEDFIPSGFCIRNAFCKGMVYSFPFIEFAEEVANNYIVTDIWGEEHDIRNIELILTASMLKLWDSYDSIEHYLSCCKKNSYKFAITKMCPRKLENRRNLNYQFLQSFELSDEDIEELVTPTVRDIRGSMGEDYIKTLIYLKGENMTSKGAIQGDNDYIKALMIEPQLINDPYIRNRINNMRQKRIRDSKIGVLSIEGCYTLISGDPYALCQSIFNMEVTGLLKAGQSYSKYWLDKGDKEVLCFRAPMTNHNNIRKVNIVTSEEMNKWYRHMQTCFILNAWDTITHAENGADKDGDAFVTTNNPVLLRKWRNLPPIFCQQKTAIKVKVTEQDLIQSNINGFGDMIGSVTNRATAMFDVMAQFDKDSKEYKEILYRIICGQHYQQCAIDKIKGIEFNPMPKEWYEIKPNIINEKDNKETIKKKNFNMSIVANKKPYFFIYNYPSLKIEYNTYKNNVRERCLIELGIDLEELLNKKDRNLKEQSCYDNYVLNCPVTETPSTMNRICWNLEDKFKDIKRDIQDKPFDYTILKSNIEYNKKLYLELKKMYLNYKNKIGEYKNSLVFNKITKDEKNESILSLKEQYKEECYSICPDKELLCEILLDLCYKTEGTKQIVWDLCGDIIIKRLLNKHENKINYPYEDGNGDTIYNGKRFSLGQATVLDNKINI